MSALDHAFFYESDNHDRVYNTDSLEHWLKKFFTTGVFVGDLQVTANGYMTVTLATGYANVDGKVRFFQTPQELLIETAHATYDRIDSVVIERNDKDRDITAKIIKGGYSSEPTPLIPVRENGVYQLVVAQISVVHGAVRITQADITDTRWDTSLCGVVAGAVEQIKFEQIQAQFDSYFENFKKDVVQEFTDFLQQIQGLEEEGQLSYDDLVKVFQNYTNSYQEMFQGWFEEIKGQLSTDAAGHLLEMIEAHKTSGDHDERYYTKEEIDKKDISNNAVEFDSEDAAEPEEYTEVEVIKSGDLFKAILNKITTMIKNTRYIWKMLGATDISKIGDGTVTGALATLNDNFVRWNVGIVNGWTGTLTCTANLKTGAVTVAGVLNGANAYNDAFCYSYDSLSSAYSTNRAPNPVHHASLFAVREGTTVLNRIVVYSSIAWAFQDLTTRNAQFAFVLGFTANQL